ncbi:MAG: sensor histidine kinase [Erythrobacter sp.]
MQLAPTSALAEGPDKPQSVSDERARLRVIAGFGPDALQDDPALAEITEFIAKLCNAPIALVTLVENERQRFLARTGLDQKGTPRSSSFCAQAMLGDGPMVIADAAEDPRFKDNPLVTGPPHIRFYAGAPLVSSEGAALGALCVIDTEPRPAGLTALQQQGLEVMARAALQRLESHRSGRTADRLKAQSRTAFRTILDSLPDIAWSADPDGTITYANERWKQVTGLADGQMDFESVKAAFHPDDLDQWRRNWLRALESQEPYEAEYRLRQADASYRWVLTRALPVFDADGQIESWFGSITDIDAGHRLSESRDLLARELAHRIKNIFAVISGLVALRSRGNPALKQFADDVVGSIHALGRAQDFVRLPGSEHEEDLKALLGALMQPYDEGGRGRIAIGGDSARFGPRAATPLALVFHELATNAAKYGALSTGTGAVRIELGTDGEDLRIVWRERGGPPIAAPPGHSGFGSRLIRSVVTGQLGGSIEQSWPGEGLELTITLPRGRLLN